MLFCKFLLFLEYLETPRRIESDELNGRSKQEEEDFLLAFKLQQEVDLSVEYELSDEDLGGQELSDEEEFDDSKCRPQNFPMIKRYEEEKRDLSEDSEESACVSDHSSSSMGESDDIDDEILDDEILDDDSMEDGLDRIKRSNINKKKNRRKPPARAFPISSDATSFETPKASPKTNAKHERRLAVEDESIWRQVHVNNGLMSGGRESNKPPSRMTSKQLDGLRWARRFLFSALIGTAEVMTEDPPLTPPVNSIPMSSIPVPIASIPVPTIISVSGPSVSPAIPAGSGIGGSSVDPPIVPSIAHSAVDHSVDPVGFTSERLTRVLRALRVPVNKEEIQQMMELWRPKTCEHSNEAAHSNSEMIQDHSIRDRLCFECWKEERKNESCFVDWNQFCWIFDDCNLKVEKNNGKVW